MSTRARVVLVVIMVAVLAASTMWMRLQWQECRAMGHSTLYCVGHVLR